MSVSSAASATSGNLLAAQFAQPVSTTPVAATATSAAAQAAAQNKQDNAVLAAPIDPVDPYAALGSADPLNLLGLTVDTTA